MSQGTWPGDLLVNGNVSCQSLSPPANSINDTALATPSAGQGVQATKLWMRQRKHYWQLAGVNVASQQAGVHVVRGTAATVLEIVAVPIVPITGADTVTVDLLKNGTTILSSVITLTSAMAAYSKTTQSGFISTALVAGDVLEVKVVANHTSGTLPQGLLVQVSLDESPS